MLNNHVLIIEDDRNIAEYFQAVLSLAGMDVEIVLSARDGLARLAGTLPGLILLDMRLGNEIGGEDILYQIRSNPRFDGTRVIVITGFPNTVQMVSDLADLVLLKPVGVDQLTSLAQRMVSFEVAPKVQAFRDPVTNLFNLEFFHTRLELAFERGKRRADFVYALIAFQVTFSSPENPDLAPDVDQSIALLAETARRLKQNLRPTDTIARATSTTFVTLHEDLRSGEDTQIIINRIQNMLAAAYPAGDASFQPSIQFGCATGNPGYHTPAEVYTAAMRQLEQARAGH